MSATDDTPPAGVNAAPAVEPPGSAGAPATSGPGSEGRDFREAWKSALALRVAGGGPSRASRTRAKRRGWLYVLAALTLATWIFDVAFHAPIVKTLPFTVLGIWRTEAPSYATRRFELRANSLVFQIGDAASLVTTHEIARVRQSQTPDGTLFLVDYFEEGQAGPQLTFTFILRSAARPEIVFAEQKHMVWTLDYGPTGATP